MRNNLHLPHNIVSLLYSIQGLVESHLARVREGEFLSAEDRLRHAEAILQRNQSQARLAIEITRRLGRLLKKQSPASLRSRRASLEKVWQSTKACLEREFLLSGVEVIERIPRDFPSLRIAPRELEEILYVVTSNALEAMRESKTSSPKKLILRAQIGFSTKEEPFAWITLADTGPGIPPSRLTRLFDPFYTAKPKGQGNGLGLFVTKELVLKNQGKITVGSFEGSGTTFTFELPLKPEALRQAAGADGK